MNKYILSVLVFVTVCFLVSAQKAPKAKVQHGACDGLSQGDDCTVGSDVAGVCEEFRNCAGESGCPLFCKVEGGSRARREKGKSAGKAKNQNSCEGKSEGDACGRDDAKVCRKVHPDCDESVEDCQLVCVHPQAV